MSSMINLKASKKTPTINVGVNPITNINVSAPPHEPTKVVYPPPIQDSYPSVSPQTATINESMSNFTSDDPEKQALLREINVLKLIIEIQHSNPILINKYIVADDEILCKMIALLCNAREVHLDAEDLGNGCISKKTYRKVNSIYIINENGETLNLKYDYPAVMKTLKDLHISVKYVF